MSGDENTTLCWLHEDHDDHWIPRSELVGVRTLIDGVARLEGPLTQAARSCAEALGEPGRIVEWPEP